MTAHHQFTAAPADDDTVHLCVGCDAPRAGPLAYCPSCEAVTESYADPLPYGAVDASKFECETMKELRVNLPARLDRIAERRAA